MGKIAEINVTKGKTVKALDRDEWSRVEYSVKAVVDDEVELEVAKSHIEGILDGWLSSTAAPSTPKTANAPSNRLESVKKAFKEDLKTLLAFNCTDDGAVIITPKQFLGAENFAKIASVVNNLGGEYVSAGKNSHFRIPPTKP